MNIKYNFKNKVFDKNNNLSIILISNSSWYLLNYRSSLIKSLIKKNQNVLAISPVDKSLRELSKLLPHIQWRIKRKSIFNPFKFLIYFFRMFFLLKTIKPKLIHSHTLSSNLICSVVALILGIPCVLSFAGLGKLYKNKGIKKLILDLILKLIATVSHQNSIFFSNQFESNIRSILIFQNKKDLNYFIDRFNSFPRNRIFLIPGSGVPAKYIESNPRGNLYWHKDLDGKLLEKKVEFIYCGRLLASKGIFTFISIANLFKENKFFVYGGIDLSQKDSLDEKKISFLKKKHTNVKFFNNKKDPFFSKDFKIPILIVPSNYGEGLPRAIIEALSLGIPVISSKNASCGIFTQKHVYISDGDKTSDYELCIKKIIDDYKSKKLLKKLKFAHKYVLQNLTEESVVEQTINSYKKISFNYSKSSTLDYYQKKLNDWIAE